MANGSANNGGAIYARFAKSLEIENTTLTGNSATKGGAIFSYVSTLSITNSTISNNHATNFGGGIYTNTSNSVDLSQTTISGNTAANSGGGLFAAASTVRITQSTLAKNDSPFSSGGALRTIGSNISISNSVLADSTSGKDCYRSTGLPSTFTLSGANLVEDKGNCGLNTSNLLQTDPMLGPLTDNGGLIMTHLPMADSPVIDMGNNGSIPPDTDYDQRGLGFPRILGGQVDLGRPNIGIFFRKSFLKTVSKSDGKNGRYKMT